MSGLMMRVKVMWHERADDESKLGNSVWRAGDEMREHAETIRVVTILNTETRFGGQTQSISDGGGVTCEHVPGVLTERARCDGNRNSVLKFT